MKLSIYRIQPYQNFLCSDTVDHLVANFDMEKCMQGMEIYAVDANGFRYVVKEGHHRLFVCHRLGIEKIDFEPKTGLNPIIIRAAKDVRREGIKSVRDLEGQLHNEFICSMILMARGG